MRSYSLAIAVLTITVAIAAAATPMTRQRRSVASWFRSTYHSVSDWFSNDLDSEAEALLKEQSETREGGLDLIDRGEILLEVAGNLTRNIVRQVTDPENGQRVRNAINRIGEAARKAVEVGRTIVRNSDNITEALRISYQNISSVVQDSLEDVGASAKVIGQSLVESTEDVILVAQSAQKTAVELIDALQEAITTMGLVEEATQSIRQVGLHAMTLGQRLYEAGQDIGTAISNAAKRIADASGLGK